MKRHLYLRIYLTILAIGLASLMAAAALAAHSYDGGHTMPPELVGGFGLVIDQLPGPDDPGFPEALGRVGDRLDADLTLYDRQGHRLGHAGPPLPDGTPGFFRGRERRGLRLRMPDGRRVALSGRHNGRPPIPLLGMIALAAGVVAVGAWPLARSITRRLETVEQGMAAWGAGDLSVRVPVDGSDEVAAVATAFNGAAERVEALLAAERRLLASASHELRSPLARIRMALELLDDGEATRQALVADAVRDVEELDRTVGDLLQVGRVQAVGVTADDPVDLAGLLREEGRHVGAAVSGPPCVVRGDEGLLRRMVRNLFDNAERHGGAPIEARTTATGLVVEDRGPGIAEGEAEAIFEAFHRPAGHAEGRDGGVGLGLSLVREIARQHGGEVVYAPRPGGGSRFEVTLPVA